ncbi:hypothetical protein [Sinomonas gamaensis]|uniref:hypothetical protein n=1 Tax=Sinomonas gamaensis TaxID=2565624 RepID=UPI0011085E01|nr:hypothetical protein [Sinomonas gamaensis]
MTAVASMMPTAADLSAATSIPPGLRVNLKRSLGDWVSHDTLPGPCRFAYFQVPAFGDETASDPSWNLPAIDFQANTDKSLYQQAIRIFEDAQGAADYVRKAAGKLPECESFTDAQKTDWTMMRKDLQGLPPQAIAWTDRASTPSTVVIVPVKKAVVQVSGMHVSDQDLAMAARTAAAKVGAALQ